MKTASVKGDSISRSMNTVRDRYKGINCAAGANYFRDDASSWRMAMFTTTYAIIVQGPVAVSGNRKVILNRLVKNVLCSFSSLQDR